MTADTLTMAGIASQVMDEQGALVQLAGSSAVLAIAANLDLNNPICIKECPDTTSTFKSCLQQVESEVQTPKEPDGSYWKKYNYEMNFVQDYGSTTMAHRYCIPKDTAMLEQLSSTFTSGLNAVMLRSSEVLTSWLVLVIAAVGAVALSYVYIFLVEKLAAILIYILLTISSVLPFLAGILFLYSGFQQDISQQMASHFGGDATIPTLPTLINREADIAVGFALLAVGLIVGIIGCCFRNSIDMVVGTVQATVNVMFDIPSLLFLPLINAATGALLFFALFFGFCLMLSVGSVSHYDINEYVPRGIARNFLSSDDDLTYIALYLYLALWIWEFKTALEQFVVAYTVQIWYNAEYHSGKKAVPCATILQSAFFGLTFHFGSLAFGSSITAFLRFLYFVVEYVRRETVRQAGGDENVNKVSQVAAGCCVCCLSCIESLIKYMNKGAYVIVAMESVGFCTAADTSATLMISEAATISTLQGATVLFQLVGAGSITGLGAYLTWILTQNVSTFNDPASDHYVAEPEIVSAAAGILCLAVSGTFMAMFDVISDMMLFAWLADRKYRKENGLHANPNMPTQLKELMAKFVDEKYHDSTMQSGDRTMHSGTEHLQLDGCTMM